MCLTGFGFGETYLGIFRVRKTANRAYGITNRRRWTQHRIGCRDEAVLALPAALASCGNR